MLKIHSVKKQSSKEYNSMIWFSFKMIVYLYLSFIYLPTYLYTYLKTAGTLFIMLLMLVTTGWCFFIFPIILHYVLLLHIIAYFLFKRLCIACAIKYCLCNKKVNAILR